MNPQPVPDPVHDLYRRVVLDHYKQPRHRKAVPGADIQAEAFNPVCGDHVVLEGRLDGGRLAEVGVRSRGCAISVASGSILAEVLTGRSLREVERFRLAAEGILGGGEVPPGEYGDLTALGGVRSFPARLQCALLAWQALRDALAGIEEEGP